MREIQFKKQNGEWHATTTNGVFLASGKTKPEARAAAIDYMLDCVNYAYNVPMLATAKDGSIFCGRQQDGGQYTIYRNNGGCTCATGQLTVGMFADFIADYNQATTGSK